MVLTSACARPPVVPATSPAPQETPSTPTLTLAPTATSTPSSTPTGPYTGPLFDTHLHLERMYLGTTAQLSRLKSAGDLLSYLDRNKVEGAIGFYTLPPNESSSSTAAKAEVIIKGTRSRVIPLIMLIKGEFVSGQYNETVLRQYLQPQGLLQGVGELGLYSGETQNITFDNPVMQTVFQVVNDLKGIVMVHPSTMGMGVRLTELDEVESSIRQYPDAIFLFHGDAAVFNLVAQLMSKYPNVYYTYDANIFSSGPGGSSLVTPPTNAADETAEHFLAEVNRIGSDRLVEVGLARVALKLQQYPDRIMWGTDLCYPWHFEEPVSDVVISLSRQLIGKLPTDVQEKYAYQNAQRVFGRFLTPNP
jgi:hypothetical protein